LGVELHRGASGARCDLPWLQAIASMLLVNDFGNRWAIPACALAALLPTVLLWNADATFYYDWHNHEWFTAYFGEYFRQHRVFPQCISSAAAVGMAQPIFYGWLLYPMLGFVAALTGAAVALRIAVAGVLLLQQLSVYAAARTCGWTPWRSAALGAMLSWAVYPLTNLYNRGALTEFFAVAFLDSALMFGIAATRCAGPRMHVYVLLSVIFAAIGAGSHPPTALMGGVFVALLCLGALVRAVVCRELRLDLAGSFLAYGSVASLLLAPWIYSNLIFRDQIYIVAKLVRFKFFPDRTDCIAGRLMPFPYDVMSGAGPTAVSTPYAEAQIALPIVLVLLASLWICRRRGVRGLNGPAVTCLICLAWLLFTVAISLSPALSDAFAFLAPYIQFPTRWVSHSNLAAITAVVVVGSCCAAVSDRSRQRLLSGVVGAAALLAFGGVLVKLRHAAFVRELQPEARYAFRSSHRPEIVTKGRADAAVDYATVKSLPQLLPEVAARAQQLSFPVGATGAAFGRVGEAEVTLGTEKWVVTNGVIFPWARVTVDGRPAASFRQAAVDHRLALRLPPGRHLLQWSWQPDPMWLGLRQAAGWAIPALAILLVANAIGTHRPRRCAARPWPGRPPAA
jgi:hypothetical protein